jgi:prevent-host-death family protein
MALLSVAQDRAVQAALAVAGRTFQDGLNNDYIQSPVPISWRPTMRLSKQVKPISYLKSNAAEVLRTLSERREPLVITQNGEAKAVIQDLESYEETQETLALLKILAMGNRDIEEGRTAAVEDVIARVRASSSPEG